MNLFEINNELRELFNNLSVNEETGEVDTTPIDLNQTEFNNKAEALALFIKEKNALATEIKAEEKALADRRKAIENKVSYLENYLSYALTEREMSNMETAKVKLSFRKSVSVDVNEEILPKEWMTEKVTYSPNKTAIKEAINSGAEIPGATLVTKQNLQIK